MAADRIERAREPRPKMVNPFQEPNSEGRLRVATSVADIYRLSSGSNSTDTGGGSLMNPWNSILNSGFLSGNAKIGAERIHELLESSAEKSSIRIKQERGDGELLEFIDPEVRNFLLDLFASDSRIAAESMNDRLQSIFRQLALDLFGSSQFLGHKNPRPENDRVKRMELYFSHESLAKAVEFFLIEPNLLPQVKLPKPDEK